MAETENKLLPWVYSKKSGEGRWHVTVVTFAKKGLLIAEYRCHAFPAVDPSGTWLVLDDGLQTHITLESIRTMEVRRTEP